MNILHIDSSVRKERSKSRELSQIAVDALKRFSVKDVHVDYLDFSITIPNHPSELYTIANYTPPEKRTEEHEEALKESNSYIRLLKKAEIYVLGVPMYNFSIPSTLKAFIDNIVRIGETFSFDGNRFSGLLKNKRAIFCTSRGGIYQEGALKELDLQEPYLKTVFEFIGVRDCYFFHAEGQDFGPPKWAPKSFEESKKQINCVVGTLNLH